MAFRRIFDHTDGPDSQQVAQGAEGLALVLDDLVINIADSGIRYGHLRQPTGVFRLVQGPCDSDHQFVDRCLVVCRNGVHCASPTLEQILNNGEFRLAVGLDGGD